MENQVQPNDANMMNILLTIIAIFLPPLAVLPKTGLKAHFWINLILTLFGFLPGFIHALLVIWADIHSKYPV